VKRENDQQQENANSIPQIGRGRKEFTICKQNKKSKYCADDKKEKLFTIICFKTNETLKDGITFFICCGEYGRKSYSNQQQVYPDNAPIYPF
jgi:hypothetical protein